MTKEKLKQELHKLIDQVEDKSWLKAFKELVELQVQSKGDFWDDLTEEQKASVKRGMEQLKRGEGYSDEEIEKEVKTLYNI